MPEEEKLSSDDEWVDVPPTCAECTHCTWDKYGNECCDLQFSDENRGMINSSLEACESFQS